MRVFLVVGVRLYREGLVEALGRRDELFVSGTSPTVTAGLDELREARPEVVLLDVSSPEGEISVADVLEAVPASKVVALAISDAEVEILDFAEAGVCGYVTRDASLDELVDAVDAAARGEAVVSPGMAAMLLRRVSTLAAEAGGPATSVRLTARELELLELMRRGLSNKEIAWQLSIALATVKNHVHNILEKLGVSRRAEAVAVVAGASGPRRSGRWPAGTTRSSGTSSSN